MAELDHQIADRLHLEGVRLTPNRRRVVEVLMAAPGPLAAAEIATSLVTVPLSSLYRSLAVLGDARVVSLHHGPDGITRYEPAEWLTGHHHHLVCTSCGTIVDFETEAGAEAALHRLAEDVAAAHAFTTNGHALEIEGQCGDCRHA